MKSKQLIILGLIKIPFLFTMLAFIIDMNVSEISFRYSQKSNFRSENMQKFLKDPQNLFKWLNLETPTLKSIRPARDRRGTYYKVIFGSEQVDVEFRMEYLSQTVNSINNGELIYQTVYRMESEYLILKFDHMANDDIEPDTALFTTDVTARLKGKMFAMAMIVGKMSFDSLLRKAFYKLVNSLEIRNPGYLDEGENETMIDL